MFDAIASFLVVFLIVALIKRFWPVPNIGDVQEEIAGTIKGPGEFGCEVVGESHYQGALEAIAGRRSAEPARIKTTARLVCEHDNPHDKNAVRVDIGGRTVGYLDRATAITYRARLEEQGIGKLTLSADALIVGGWDRGNGDRGHFGVKLDLPVE